jgi:hypothetical protein
MSNFRNKNIVIVCHTQYGNRTREFKVGYYRDPTHLLNNIHNWTAGKVFTVVDVENTDHLTDKEHNQLWELDFEPLYK